MAKAHVGRAGAAILFSDILIVPDALGQGVRFVEGEGPRLDPRPKNGSNDLSRAPRCSFVVSPLRFEQTRLSWGQLNGPRSP